jgi:hypothetical protein
MRRDAVRGKKNANTLSLQRNTKVIEEGSRTSGFDNTNGNNRKDEGSG